MSAVLKRSENRNGFVNHLCFEGTRRFRYRCHKRVLIRTRGGSGIVKNVWTPYVIHVEHHRLNGGCYVGDIYDDIICS